MEETNNVTFTLTCITETFVEALKQASIALNKFKAEHAFAEGITPEELAEHIRKALSGYHPRAVKAILAAIEQARMSRPE